MENGLTSKYTSFVGVDKRTGKPLEDKPMSTREIKNQVPSGFGMTFGGGHTRMVQFSPDAGSLGGQIERASAPGMLKMRSSNTKCKKSGRFIQM